MASPVNGTTRASYRRTTSTISSNTRKCATSTVRRPLTITWSSTTNSTTSRKTTAASGIAKKTSPGTSSANATISNARWATLPATLTTKPSDASCSYTTTRWAQTTTCSASSDPFSPSLLASSRHQGRLENFTNMFQIINCAFNASNKG